MLFRFKTTHPQTSQPLTVLADYLPAIRGSRDQFGAPEEPDSPAEIRIKQVELGNDLIHFADIEADLEREGFEQFRKNHNHVTFHKEP